MTQLLTMTACTCFSFSSRNVSATSVGVTVFILLLTCGGCIIRVRLFVGGVLVAAGVERDIDS